MIKIVHCIDISTSLIHNVASEGKSEHELTWVLRILSSNMKNVEGVGICQIEPPKSEVIVDQPRNSVDLLLLLERKNSWLTVSMQISAMEWSLDFVLHF